MGGGGRNRVDVVPTVDDHHERHRHQLVVVFADHRVLPLHRLEVVVDRLQGLGVALTLVVDRAPIRGQHQRRQCLTVVAADWSDRPDRRGSWVHRGRVGKAVLAARAAGRVVWLR